jgi:hypothetical protein
MKWYDWGSIRTQLVTFGRAIQGVSPYKVIIEPDSGKCPTGWCNYTRREIAVNPDLFPHSSPADQYRATKAILVHEAGHRRFTTPSTLGPIVHEVFNILEDERIERLMSAHFAGLGYLLLFLSRTMLADLPPLNPSSDNPSEVLNYILRMRWAERAGVKIEQRFSPLNTQRWKEVEPLVRKAWTASTSLEVEQLAKRIAAILGLREVPEWLRKLLSKFGSLEGTRATNDVAEEGHGTGKTRAAKSTVREPDFDGLPIPDDYPAGRGMQKVKPVPYLPLVAQVQPFVDELVAELQWSPKDSGPEPASRGQRFSMRQWIRQPDLPFLSESDAPKEPPRLAFRVLIDHSTSMNIGERIQAAREGAMMLHLVGVRLNIPHEIALTPNDIRIANLTSGERGLALIAGLEGEMTYEGIDVTLATHTKELLADRADIKLVLVVHDGYPDNPDRLKSLCQYLRGKVEVIGLGLDYDEVMAETMKELFGSDRLILCRTPEELPRKLGTLLRVIYGT